MSEGESEDGSEDASEDGSEDGERAWQCWAPAQVLRSRLGVCEVELQPGQHGCPRTAQQSQACLLHERTRFLLVPKHPYLKRGRRFSWRSSPSTDRSITTTIATTTITTKMTIKDWIKKETKINDKEK